MVTEPICDDLVLLLTFLLMPALSLNLALTFFSSFQWQVCPVMLVE